MCLCLFLNGQHGRATQQFFWAALPSRLHEKLTCGNIIYVSGSAVDATLFTARVVRPMMKSEGSGRSLVTRVGHIFVERS